MSATQSMAQPAQINAKLIVPFVNSVRSVFSTMVRVQTTVQRPYLKTHSHSPHDISSIIGFSGEVVGSVVVSLNREAAQELVKAFAGMELEMDSPDFADAVGELSNMIAGCAKKDLGATASITVPTVIIGRGHTVARLSDVPCICIPCSTPVGDFVVEVNIRQLSPQS